MVAVLQHIIWIFIYAQAIDIIPKIITQNVFNTLAFPRTVIILGNQNHRTAYRQIIFCILFRRNTSIYPTIVKKLWVVFVLHNNLSVYRIIISGTSLKSHQMPTLVFVLQLLLLLIEYRQNYRYLVQLCTLITTYLYYSSINMFIACVYLYIYLYIYLYNNKFTA